MRKLTVVHNDEWRNKLCLMLRMADSGDTIVTQTVEADAVARSAAHIIFPDKQLEFELCTNSTC